MVSHRIKVCTQFKLDMQLFILFKEGQQLDKSYQIILIHNISCFINTHLVKYQFFYISFSSNDIYIQNILIIIIIEPNTGVNHTLFSRLCFGQNNVSAMPIKALKFFFKTINR